jgi:filamentous hemagglutinin
LDSGQLMLAPHTVDGIEISHAVLSGGRAVIAAGEADIAAAGGVFFGTEITPHSGHYLNGASTADSDTSLELAKKAFEALGITFR